MLKNKNGQVEIVLFVIFTIFIYSTALFLFYQSSQTIEEEVNDVGIISNVSAKRQILEQTVLQIAKSVINENGFDENSYIDQDYLKIKETFVNAFPEFYSQEEYLSEFSKKVREEDFSYKINGNRLVFLFEDVEIKDVFTDEKGKIISEVSYISDFQIIYVKDKVYSVEVK